MAIGNLSHFFKWEDGNIGVAQGFAVDDFGVGPDGGFKILRVARVHESDLNAELGQGVLELVVRPTIQAAGRDDVVAGFGQGEDGLGLGGVPAAGGQGGDAAFQAGDALFEHIGGRVHQAGVDVTEFLECK